MEILKQEPPNFEAIKTAFPAAIETRSTIFAYAPNIYNPFGLEVKPENVAHEEVHFEQQAKMGVEAWWREYIANAEFRADQELPAYHAEYKFLKRNKMERETLAKRARQMAHALSGPNYDECIPFRDALQFITGRVI